MAISRKINSPFTRLSLLLAVFVALVAVVGVSQGKPASALEPAISGPSITGVSISSDTNRKTLDHFHCYPGGGYRNYRKPGYYAIGDTIQVTAAFNQA